MKKIGKNAKVYFIGMLIGGIALGLTTVVADTIINSKNVIYKTTTVKAALDNLYDAADLKPRVETLETNMDGEITTATECSGNVTTNKLAASNVDFSYSSRPGYVPILLTCNISSPDPYQDSNYWQMSIYNFWLDSTKINTRTYYAGPETSATYRVCCNILFVKNTSYKD